MHPSPIRKDTLRTAFSSALTVEASSRASDPPRPRTAASPTVKSVIPLLADGSISRSGQRQGLANDRVHAATALWRYRDPLQAARPTAEDLREDAKGDKMRNTDGYDWRHAPSPPLR